MAFGGGMESGMGATPGTGRGYGAGMEAGMGSAKSIDGSGSMSADELRKRYIEATEANDTVKANMYRNLYHQTPAGGEAFARGALASEDIPTLRARLLDDQRTGPVQAVLINKEIARKEAAAAAATPAPSGGAADAVRAIVPPATPAPTGGAADAVRSIVSPATPAPTGGGAADAVMAGVNPAPRNSPSFQGQPSTLSQWPKELSLKKLEDMMSPDYRKRYDTAIAHGMKNEAARILEEWLKNQ
jgi:hypothetical protein